MGYEIDFLSVGDGSKSGDAIAFRYGCITYGTSHQVVGIIDGGTKETGKALVEHVRTYYETERVDIVVSSHPDADHASGLTVVLEELDVGLLLMHKPWEHTREMQHLFATRFSHANLENKLIRALKNVSDLEDLAVQKGIRVEEPFTGVGTQDGALYVLGPDRDYYEQLVCDFRETPEAKQPGLVAKAYGYTGELLSRFFETMDIETLDDSGVTSAENNSSVILLLRNEGNSFLFTADAGIPALTRAADHAASIGIDLSALGGFQVPHHGSRRNVGPTILNRIKAPSALISVCKDGAPKHPSKRVTNALRRRNSGVYATKGVGICHRHGVPPRNGWSNAESLPFYATFEE